MSTVRVEYLGLNIGAVTIKMAGGKQLDRPLRAGSGPLHKFHDVSPADAEALVATGNWRYISAPEIDLSQAAVPQQAPPPSFKPEVSPETTPAPAPDDPNDMTVAEAKAYALLLDAAGLEAFKTAEEAGKNRSSLISTLETMIADAKRVEQVPE